MGKKWGLLPRRYKPQDRWEGGGDGNISCDGNGSCDGGNGGDCDGKTSAVTVGAGEPGDGWTDIGGGGRG